jgi:hypothetical protein
MDLLPPLSTKLPKVRTAEHIANAPTRSRSIVSIDLRWSYRDAVKRRKLAMDVSIIQQVKIQALVLVPLVKALQIELGEERANALVRRTLGAIYRRYGEEFWSATNGNDLGKAMGPELAAYARDNALDYKMIEQSQDAFAFDVTTCRYAEFYKELGEPELGFLLVCSADFDLAEGFGPDIKLSRTQTIMQGGSHCDFRYKRSSSVVAQ